MAILLLLVVSCQPRAGTGDSSDLVDTADPARTAAFAEPAPQTLRGEGSGRVPVAWEGPAILRIQIGKGPNPFSVSIQKELNSQLLVKGDAPIDEYRGYEFTSGAAAEFFIEGERSWEIQLLPVSAHYFKSLHIPGIFAGDGNAVILLDGKHGVSTFDTTRARRLEAWAYGPGGVGDQLYIKPDGDYKGKSVLPVGAEWIIVSATGPWSVEVQGPCCELIR
jgi:hypothetical protein